MLPYINQIPKSRSFISAFRGYNHNAHISENELYDDYNLTADEYPVLSTRKARGKTTDPKRLYHGLYGENGLAVIYSDDDTGQMHFTYNGTEYDVTLTAGYVPRCLVGFGTKILIYPDGVWFDTLSKESGEMRTRTAMNTYELRYGEPEYDDMSPFDVDNDHYVFNFTEGYGWYIANRAGSEETNIYIMLKIPDAYLHADFDENELRVRVGRYVERMGDISRQGDYYIFKGVIVANAAPRNRMLVSDGDILLQEYEDGDYVPFTPAYERDMTLHFNNVRPPLMDYVIECQNRLWGCRKGLNRAGVEVNEIYASRLGTFDDWYSYEETADSPYAASVGTPGDFTGVVKVSQNPIFFKERCAHKVYVSSSGSHQIITLDVRGVQSGSGESISTVNEIVYYKGVRDVLAFDGSNVSIVSDALGSARYINARSGAYGDKYVMYCEDEKSNKYIFSYDTRKGIWHRDLVDGAVVAMTDHGDDLLFCTDYALYSYNGNGDESESVSYMLESGVIGYETADAKFLVRLDMRIKLGFGTTMTVWMQYDSDGKWIEAVRHRGTTVTPRMETINVLPRRCDHFKYKITGKGDFQLYGLQKTYERSAK